MRLFIIGLCLLATPVLGYDMGCVATRVCRGEVCKANSNSETGVRLEGGGSASPSLTSDMEKVPLRQTRAEGDLVQFEGSNASGGREMLAIDRRRNLFTYIRHPNGGFKGMTFNGTCEVWE